MSAFGARRTQAHVVAIGPQVYFQDGMTDAITGQDLTARSADVFGSYRLEGVNMPIYNVDALNRIQSVTNNVYHSFEFIPQSGRVPGRDKVRFEGTFIIHPTMESGNVRVVLLASNGDAIADQVRIQPIFSRTGGGTTYQLRIVLRDDSDTNHTLYAGPSNTTNYRRVTIEVDVLSDSSVRVHAIANGAVVINSQTFNYDIANRGNRVLASLFDVDGSSAARLAVNEDEKNQIFWSDDLQVLT